MVQQLCEAEAQVIVQAEQLLRGERLLDVLVRDVQYLGVAGEEQAIKLVYLSALSAKLARPDDAGGIRPISLIIKGPSSVGKNYLLDRVLKLVPDEVFERISRATPRSLYYLEEQALKNKLLVLEELEGAEETNYALRTLQSEGRLRLLVAVPQSEGPAATEELVVEGPTALILTTTQPQIRYDNETRAFSLHLDESRAQTSRVHRKQCEHYQPGKTPAKEKRNRIKDVWHAIWRRLEPRPVWIPFAGDICFPTDSVRRRRDHARFLDLIAVIALLHQYQRERKDGWLIAELEDYCMAYEIVKPLLRSDLLLDETERTILTLCRELDQGEGVTRNDLKQELGKTYNTVKDRLEKLVHQGLLIKDGSGQPFRYRGAAVDAAPGLTSPEELERRLSKG
jgi:hypothetical protein